MIHVSMVATETAHRLWVRDGTVADKNVAEVTERISDRLEVGLARWIGSDGYRMLLERAVQRARADYPALAELSCQSGRLQGVPTAVQAHGAPAVTKSIPGLVALVIDSLGRVVGEDMAVRMVEQAWEANAFPGSTAEKKGA